MDELVKIIEKKAKKFYNKINQAQKLFRNFKDVCRLKLTELINGIINAAKLGGKILVINFHSIEDKIVKFFFTKLFKNPRLSDIFR